MIRKTIIATLLIALALSPLSACSNNAQGTPDESVTAEETTVEETTVEETTVEETLADKYLKFGESKELISTKTVDVLVDTFNKVYGDICDFFNDGKMLKVTYVIDPDYDGVAYASGGKIVLSKKWIKQNPNDTDCMTHELVHIAQNYGSNVCPGWITEGLADYGRAKFGLNNKKGGWSLPKYDKSQKYTDSYRVTAAFFIWLEENVDETLPKDLNDTIKAGEYRNAYFVNKTGKKIDELWQMYADASKK